MQKRNAVSRVGINTKIERLCTRTCTLTDPWRSPVVRRRVTRHQVEHRHVVVAALIAPLVVYELHDVNSASLMDQTRVQHQRQVRK